MDKEMLEAIGQMLDTKLAANNGAMRAEMSQMLDAKLEPIKADIAELKQGQKALEQQQAEQTEFERGTRALIENKVMPAIQTVAEQHGEIVGRLKRLEARHETSQALRSHVKTLEDVVRTHTERIEELESKIG